MNANCNEHNDYKKKRNDGINALSDAIMNKLLEKYNFSNDAVTVRNNIPVNSNKSENRNTLGKESIKHASKTTDNYIKPNINDILQKYSMNCYDNEINITEGSDDLKNYNDFINNADENTFRYNRAIKNHSENKLNLEGNLAFMKTKVNIHNNDSENYKKTNQDKKFSSNKPYAEKTTYCRPVFNIFNQEFIYKTLDRNAKLQALLKKLIFARRREKEKEEWNNYVNELKNKHNCFKNRPRHIIPQHVPQKRLFSEPNDIYKINQKEPDKHVMNDFYAYDDVAFRECYYPPKQEMVGEGSGFGYLYENELHCYPTASQGRLMMMQRERARRNLDVANPHLPPYRSICPRPQFIYVDKQPHAHNSYVEDVMTEQYEDIATSTTQCKGTITKEPKNEITAQYVIQDNAVQTENSETGLKLGETTKDKYEMVTENVNRLKALIESKEQKIQHQNSLRKIESKLDVLVKSIQHLMADLKINSSSTILSSINVAVNKPEADIEQGSTSRKPDREQLAKTNEAMIVGHVETNTSTSAFKAFPKRRHFQPTTRIDNIICEELDKSNKLRQELGELLHTQTRHHSVQITVDIPTRERATEVTDSLSRTVFCDKGIEELGSSLDEQDSQMTIAVNTDPLGLLTLLTMSTDVVKQLISYVPAVDYGWYLSRLPLPHISARNVTDFVCNLCGAAFVRPSQLSDHMKNHDLGDTKDCCVCRHALDQKRRPPGLFACRYCGQRFTRAYCCELHQQSCARALGFSHDVDSSLALLR